MNPELSIKDLPIEIVAYEAKYAEAFARLNREWLDAFDLFEEADANHLYSPEEKIIDPGGKIFIATRGEEVVGTCAFKPLSAKVCELIKLTVAPQARGKGLGRLLVQVVLKEAQKLGASRVSLLSSSKLSSAIRLYESLGFKHEPVPPDQPYESADVYMVFSLRDDF